jgi:hypothetical protein
MDLGKVCFGARIFRVSTGLFEKVWLTTILGFEVIWELRESEERVLQERRYRSRADNRHVGRQISMAMVSCPRVVRNEAQFTSADMELGPP